jgi:DnaK suppressor protein
MGQSDELTVNVRSPKEATIDSKHLIADWVETVRGLMPGHISAAPQQSPLDLEKQQLKYGPRSLRRQQTKAPVKGREGSGERMAKSDQAHTARRVAGKVAATGENDGPDAAVHKNSAPRRPRQKTAGRIVLPEGYRPAETEPFMNERHKAYFRKKLLDWKEEIVRENRETLLQLHEDSAQHADFADRATSETERALELRDRDRKRKLIAKIDAALARIEDGSYGFCEETGEPIGLRRLDARPIATLSLEAQERHERREKVFRED